MTSINTSRLLHTLTTSRLLITPLAPIHKNLYVELYTNEKIMRNIAKPLSVTQAQRCFDLAIKHNQSSPSKQLTWAIIVQQSGEAIGIQGLTFDKNNANEAEIGIMLLSNYQQCGFAYEALTEQVNFINNNNMLNVILAKVHLTNKNSIALFNKLNFKKIYQQNGIITLYLNLE